MNPAYLLAAALAAPVAPPVTFDFPFPPCQGVTEADNPYHVTTVSDPGLPRTDSRPLGSLVLGSFLDAGTYTAVPSVTGDPARAGRYLDHYEAVASGTVTLDETGAIATAGHLTERRDITLWVGRRLFFHETWRIDVDNYDENTTQPVVTDRCGPA